ncbi:complement decay-accelerating factor isoform X2 [Halichoeres trimaculatus]|uniref:complement decay-accelerating factor isoform X2 n=1 Tax=Halichoeres trimaculatus TaxID=147232 RepID=UPI003D9EEEE7
MDVFRNTCGIRGVRTLLLFYLLIVEAAVFAAECPRPEGRDNIVLTTAALLMNDFPEGSEVTLECGNGFETDSGSGVITCIDGKWSEPDLTCKKKDCGPPPPKENMSFDTSGGTLFGALVKVLCDKGYRLNGSGFKQCYATGWSGKAKCEVVTCKIPAGVTNGKHSWDSEERPKYSETIQFSCDAGFSLIGTDSITCTETGGYDSEPPVCQGVGIILSTIAAPKVTKISINSPTSAAAATLPPAPQGGRDLMTAGEEATPSIDTPTTSLQDKHDATLETNNDIGSIPAIIGGILAVLVAGSLLFGVYKFVMKKKGSYDTREDLKPELLQFQNL